jgi:hypothetical protein
VLDENLKNRISEDLHKSGFQSEMAAVEAFLVTGWQCEGSFTYRDRESNSSREIDLQATFTLSRARQRGGSVQCGLRVLAEVKKSEEPWVAFRERASSPTQLLDAWNNLTYTLNLPTEQVALADALSQHSLLSTNGWKARGVHESFKRPSTPSRWYAAGVAACKAAESALEAEAATLDPLRPNFSDSILFVLIKPIIILDGPFVSAHLKDGETLVIEEITSAAFRFQHRTSEYTRDSYSLDVVTMEALPAYIASSERRLRSFMEALVQADSAAVGEEL